MIPRDVEILYEKKQLVLEQQVQSSTIVSNFVAGSIQSQVSKESALSKTIRWRFFRLQVQPLLLHRSFSARQSVHNCIFNIKYCSNWTRGKRTRMTKRRLNFVHSGLHILRNAMLLWFCSRKVARFPVTLSTTCILLLSYTELFFPLKLCTFSSSICFRLKRNLNWKTWKFWKPIEKLTWLTYDRLADLACCEKYLKDNKHNSLNLT